MISFLMQDVWQKRLLAGLFVVVAATTILVNMNRGLFVDDDNLWFQMLTYKILEPAEITTAENRMVDLFIKDKASDNQIIRLTDKREYTYNYLMPTVLWTVGRLLVEPFTGHMPYEKQLAISLLAGFWFATVVAFGIFLLIAWRARLSLRWWYAIAGVAVVALIGCLLPGPKPPNFMILNEYRNDAIRLMGYFTQDPSYSFSAFSFTARNNYIIMLLGFFLARWSGRDVLAYGVLTATIIWHASMGMMMLMTILAIDLATRPQIFRRIAIIAPVLLATAYYLVVESIWKKMGAEVLYILAPLALALALYVLLVRRIPVLPVLQPVVSWWGRQVTDRRAAVDLALFTLGWLITIPIVARINNQVEFTQSLYFWSQLHIRIYSVWQPAFILFVLYQLFPERPHFWRALGVLVLGYALCVSSLVYMTARKDFHPIPSRLLMTGEFLENAATGKSDMSAYKKYGIVMPADCFLPEAMAYYLIIKEKATGAPAVDDYLARRPKGMRLDCSPG